MTDLRAQLRLAPGQGRSRSPPQRLRSRRGSIAPPRLLVEEQRREHHGDERRDERQRDPLGKGHPADPPEEEHRHQCDHGAPADVDPECLAAGPRKPTRKVKPATDQEICDRSPDAYGDDPDGKDKVLHHRIHDGQHGDCAERCSESLKGMLDAAHPRRLADYSAASSVCCLGLGFDLGGLCFHQPHDMVDHVAVFNVVIGNARTDRPCACHCRRR